jgi:hypothetical protein
VGLVVKMIKVKDSIWFNTIGIVYGENETGERKAYIGEGEGYNKKDDEVFIAQYGMPIYESGLKTLLDYLKG